MKYVLFVDPAILKNIPSKRQNQKTCKCCLYCLLCDWKSSKYQWLSLIIKAQVLILNYGSAVLRMQQNKAYITHKLLYIYSRILFLLTLFK